MSAARDSAGFSSPFSCTYLLIVDAQCSIASAAESATAAVAAAIIEVSQINDYYTLFVTLSVKRDVKLSASKMKELDIPVNKVNRNSTPKSTMVTVCSVITKFDHCNLRPVAFFTNNVLCRLLN